MREIKFRAWAGEMFMVDGISFDHRLVFYWVRNDRYEVSMDKCKLMQFTGLKDKNGKEIYEGDLLQDKRGNIRDIHWHNNGGCWATKCLTDTGHHPEFDDEKISHGWVVMNGCEVIGNIYENPELMKQQARDGAAE